MNGTAAERSVLGAMLLDGAKGEFARGVCTPEDFSDQRHGAIFAGMLRMLTDGDRPDVVTVGGHLTEWGVRGITDMDLHQWVTDTPYASGVTGYAELVHAEGTIRAARNVASSILDMTGENPSAPGMVVQHALESFKRIRDGFGTARVSANPLQTVLDLPDSYDWVIPGLLERGDRVLFTGGEGSGKSTLVRQMSVLASAGLHPFTGERVDPVRVLVVDAENTERQWARAVRKMADKAATLGTVDPRQALRLTCNSRLDLTTERDLGSIHRLMDEHTPDVLFIGPLYRLVPRAINNDDDATPLLAALDTLRARGAALVMEAHAGHAVGQDRERDLRPRGSAALMGWPEFGLGIRPNRQEAAKGIFDVVRWRADRDQRAWPRQLVKGGEWPWSPLTAENSKHH
jgi:hypothetical protein